jgi:hypothetical protein
VHVPLRSLTTLAHVALQINHRIVLLDNLLPVRHLLASPALPVNASTWCAVHMPVALMQALDGPPPRWTSQLWPGTLRRNILLAICLACTEAVEISSAQVDGLASSRDSVAIPGIVQDPELLPARPSVLPQDVVPVSMPQPPNASAYTCISDLSGMVNTDLLLLLLLLSAALHLHLTNLLRAEENHHISSILVRFRPAPIGALHKSA